MSDYYTPKRTRNLYESGKGFKISRSKIDLFTECPRCFYMDRKLGIARPPGFPFTLNSAVDKLLKKEFDVHRAGKSKHPLMEEYKIDGDMIVVEDLATFVDVLDSEFRTWDETTRSGDGKLQ